MKAVDNDYLETFGLELLAGGWLRSSSTWQPGNEFIVNEAALKSMGIENPEDAIGSSVELGVSHISGHIVGVVKDFHVRSLRDKIPPTILFYFPRLYYEAGVKISGRNVPESLDAMESAWKSVYPNEIFQYTFMDELLAQMYDQEVRVLVMFNIFSGISIFIACLGLFGLIAFTIHQRMSEIGIRKVFGAQSGHIVWILSNRFLLLVGIAALVSFPVGYVVMSNWLDSFAYRVNGPSGLLPACLADYACNHWNERRVSGNPDFCCQSGQDTEGGIGIQRGTWLPCRKSKIQLASNPAGKFTAGTNGARGWPI